MPIGRLALLVLLAWSAGCATTTHCEAQLDS